MNQKRLSLAAATACLVASFASQAAEPRSSTCTLGVQMKQGSVSAPVTRLAYDKTFTVVDGDTYFDDFGNILRFRDLTVQAVPGTNRDVTLRFFVYADVGVFDWIDFSTEMTLSRDDAPVVSRGSSSYGNTTQGDHFTDWSISCQRNK